MARYDPAVIDYAIELYADGLSYAAITAKLGISRDTVWRNAKARGVLRRRPGVDTERVRPESKRPAVDAATRSQIIRLRADGQAYGTIAGRYGLHVEQVRRVCQTPEAQDAMFAVPGNLVRVRRGLIWTWERAGERPAVEREKPDVAPDCGTEAGYQAHRKAGPWPLPKHDPCGCRDAHRQHYHRLLGMRELAAGKKRQEGAA